MKSIRENDILHYLAKRKRASTKELCRYLHCSVSTLRRDLLSLEAQFLVKRIHGGVILNEKNSTEYSQTFRETINPKEKETIALFAKDFISPGMCVFLDSSSTVLPLVKQLITIPNLIVVTNGLKTALALSETHNETLQVFMTGGEVKLNRSSVISTALDSIATDFRYDVAFFSCRGLDINGIYEASYSQAQLKKSMMYHARERILLVDHSKFESHHFFNIGRFSDYSAIVTDHRPSKKYLEKFQQVDIHCIFPGMSDED